MSKSNGAVAQQAQDALFDTNNGALGFFLFFLFLQTPAKNKQTKKSREDQRKQQRLRQDKTCTRHRKTTLDKTKHDQTSLSNKRRYLTRQCKVHEDKTRRDKAQPDLRQGKTSYGTNGLDEVIKDTARPGQEKHDTARLDKARRNQTGQCKSG